MPIHHGTWIREGALAGQVPFESLRRTARDRKGVLDEVYSVVSIFKSSSSDGAPSQQEAAVVLDAAVSRLQSLKRKVILAASALLKTLSRHML